MTTPARIVDALGTFCPVPVHILARAVARMAPGDEAVLLADDPLVRIDVPAWCHTHGHDLVDVSDDPSGGWRLTVRVASGGVGSTIRSTRPI